MTHPTDDKALYDRSYFDGYYLNDQKRERAYLQERDRILRYYPQGARVLDIGCGVGGFLDTFDDRWEKYGIEPSDFARERAAGKGIKMLPTINTIETETFDVVIFRGSLQHIAFPMEAITQAARVLRRGGLMVFLAIPDTDSLVYCIWHNLPALDAPKNWVVFGGRVLANILQRQGFVVKVTHPYIGTPYAQPVKDIFNFIISLFFGWRKFAFWGNMMEVYAVKLP